MNWFQSKSHVSIMCNVPVLKIELFCIKMCFTACEVTFDQAVPCKVCSSADDEVRMPPALHVNVCMHILQPSATFTASSPSLLGTAAEKGKVGVARMSFFSLSVSLAWSSCDSRARWVCSQPPASSIYSDVFSRICMRPRVLLFWNQPCILLKSCSLKK